MTRTEHLLCIVAEECSEVAQRASKALRFGMNEVQPGQAKNNMDRMIQEFADLTAAMRMAIPYCFDDEGFEKMVDAKTDQVEHFLKYSEAQGTLTGE
jgi:hypothetical protein